MRRRRNYSEACRDFLGFHVSTTVLSGGRGGARSDIRSGTTVAFCVAFASSLERHCGGSGGTICSHDGGTSWKSQRSGQKPLRLAFSSIDRWAVGAPADFKVGMVAGADLEKRHGAISRHRFRDESMAGSWYPRERSGDARVAPPAGFGDRQSVSSVAPPSFSQTGGPSFIGNHCAIRLWPTWTPLESKTRHFVRYFFPTPRRLVVGNGGSSADP